MKDPVTASHRHMGFTGTKTGVTRRQRAAMFIAFTDLREDGFLWMHNGDCVGADDTAADVWHDVGGKIYLHPPSNEKFRAFHKAEIICESKPYLRRDEDIAASAHTLVACPAGYEEETRSGTWTTVRRAAVLRRRIILIFPDGTKQG